MEGLHLTADCFACACEARLLTDQQQLRSLLQSTIAASGLSIVGEHYHPFIDENGQPAGVTAAVLLAESHVALHTWPEKNAVTLDVYVCNFMQDNCAKARQALHDLVQAFQPANCLQAELQRGTPQALAVRERLSAHSYWGTAIAAPILNRHSEFQQIEIAESAEFGKVMRLDGAMMTSEKDEFFYHETLVHPAAITHPAPRHVLIIGGGDGGSSEELLKHPSIESLVLCELDAAVVDVATHHLTQIHRGALLHPKLEKHYADGFAYVQQSQRQFDLILLDLTDPEAPDGSTLAATCMTPEFFQSCRQRLNPGGMLVMHLGSPVYHANRFQQSLAKLTQHFAIVRPYTVFIPLYGAIWGMAIASVDADPCQLNTTTVKQRLKQRGVENLNYYNPAVHQALFALPNYVEALLPDSIKNQESS